MYEFGIQNTSDVKPRLLLDTERKEAYNLLKMLPLELPPPKLHGSVGASNKGTATSRKGEESAREIKVHA